MLRELRIRNVAVIETVVIPFEAGLNVLTGETGAGKSILVDAILLVRGAAAQIDLLDRFAGIEDTRARVAELHGRFQAAAAALAELKSTVRDAAQREDLLRFQVSELDAARLRPGEEEELRTERRRLQHAERFAAGLEEVGTLLQDDAASAAARLARATRVLTDLGRLDPAFGAPVERVEAARVQADEP